MIEIKGTKVELKYSLNILFTWERLCESIGTSKDGLLSSYLMFYCGVICSEDSLSSMSFDEFIEICSEDAVSDDPKLMPAWVEWWTGVNSNKKKQLAMSEESQ